MVIVTVGDHITGATEDDHLARGPMVSIYNAVVCHTFKDYAPPTSRAQHAVCCLARDPWNVL
eukprot:11188847-Lingulodinium_polyedra.AAC.1